MHSASAVCGRDCRDVRRDVVAMMLIELHTGCSLTQPHRTSTLPRCAVCGQYISSFDIFIKQYSTIMIVQNGIIAIVDNMSCH